MSASNLGLEFVKERSDSIQMQDLVATNQEEDVRSGGDQDYAMDFPKYSVLT